MNPQQAAMQDVLNKVDTGAICLKTAITNFMVYGLIEDLVIWSFHGAILQVKGYSQSSLSAELQASLSPSSRGQYLHSTVSPLYLFSMYSLYTQNLLNIYTVSASKQYLLNIYTISSPYLLRSV